MTRMVFPRFLLKSYVPLEHERFVRFRQDPFYADVEASQSCGGNPRTFLDASGISRSAPRRLMINSTDTRGRIVPIAVMQRELSVKPLCLPVRQLRLDLLKARNAA